MRVSVYDFGGTKPPTPAVIAVIIKVMIIANLTPTIAQLLQVWYVKDLSMAPALVTYKSRKILKAHPCKEEYCHPLASFSQSEKLILGYRDPSNN